MIIQNIFNDPIRNFILYLMSNYIVKLELWGKKCFFSSRIYASSRCFFLVLTYNWDRWNSVNSCFDNKYIHILSHLTIYLLSNIVKCQGGRGEFNFQKDLFPFLDSSFYFLTYNNLKSFQTIRYLTAFHLQMRYTPKLL